MKKIFHFLGGIYFAIFLIAVAAATVIAGTFLESCTESHLYASSWTYSHPLFSLLLGLFFINILFSALRRWPFKTRHIAFLITHLGLLMIIAGTIIKNKMGVQGNLSVWEGSGAQKILLPNSFSLHVDKRDGQQADYPLASLEPWQIYQKPPFSELKLKIVGMTPHSSEKWETWIKGHLAIITGIPPLSVIEWSNITPLPKPQLLPISSESNWEVMAIRTDHLQDLLQKVYLERLEINVFPNVTQEILQKSLSFSFKDSRIHDPILKLEIPMEKNQTSQTFQIPLSGSRALYPSPDAAYPKHQIALKRPFPLLILAEENQGDTFLILLDQYGRIHGENFGQARMKSLVSYDNGFGGYAVQTSLPHPAKAFSLKETEDNNQKILCAQLRDAMTKQPSLVPPLKFFKEACDQLKLDFIPLFVNFLVLWDQQPNILFSPSVLPKPLENLISTMDLEAILPLDQKAIQWIALLFDRLDESLQAGDEIFELLKRNRWPSVEQLKADSRHTNIFTLLTQQIYTLLQDLPDLEQEPQPSLSQKTKLLSAYLKAYGIDYASIRTFSDENTETMSLETPLTVRYRKEVPSKKYEDNHPSIIVEASTGLHKELFALTYDPSSLGFKWPILHGQYLIRLQPESLEIPYRVRLKQARQINYPQTQQAYSYEGDIWIQEKGQEPIEKTLSMNQVHETWDGYRFYLAGMTPLSDQGVRRAHIIVNHDPAKYYLTYPGAALVALGIVLLFWLMPYRKKIRNSESRIKKFGIRNSEFGKN